MNKKIYLLLLLALLPLRVCAEFFYAGVLAKPSGYTEQMLYVGVICYDKDPGQIIVTDSRRDSSLDETDSFQFILDGFNDRQNGLIFGTNPAGLEYDAQVTKEGTSSFGFAYSLTNDFNWWNSN
jgi:hypothetical protein